jgi:antitoxin component of RelBE/YafQ-DinJ toxin-antitoxin module
MAILPKSHYLQVRIESDLHVRYRAMAEAKHMTVSQAIRHQMYSAVEQFEAIQARKLKSISKGN